jgi:hypothetical protein
MKIYLILGLLFSVAFSFKSYSQVSISGKLLERGTKTPLEGVNVFILPHKLKSVTDKQGKFIFDAVPEGDFEFIVNNSGYIRLKMTVNSTVPEHLLYLEKEFYGVFETTVTALADKKDFTKKSLSQKDFIKAPGAQEDPVKAVQNLPGIANQSVSAQVVIQGSEPDDTRYTLNGHEIPIVFHFGGLSSVIMPQAVESVDFLSSGYGPEYGRALGGIINLQTRKPKTDRIHGMAFVDIYNTGGLIEGPIDDTSSFFLSGRYSYIGQVLKKVAEENEDFNLTTAPTFSDLFFVYDKKISDKMDFSFTAVRSKDELQFVLNEPIGNNPILRGDFYQKTEFFRFLPRLIYKINDKQTLDFSLGYGDNNIFAEVGDNFFKLDTTSFTKRIEIKTKVSEDYTQYMGLDLLSNKFNVGLKFPTRDADTGVTSGDTELTTISGENNQNAFYLRNQLTFMSKKLIFTPNFRLERFEETDETYLMPRVTLAYKTISDLTYSLSTGLYYQAPQNGEAAEDFGNPELNSERAVHYTLGIEKDFRQGSSNGSVLNLDFFYKKLDQLIIPTSDKNADNSPKVNSNEGTGDINGIQVQYKWKNAEYSFVGAYTYLQSNRKNPGEKEYPSDFDQTHNLNFIASLEKKRWTYSTRLRYVTGRPLTPIESGIFDSDNDVYVPINGERFSERLDPFFQLDIRFDRKWVYNTWILSAYLDIQNITNSENVQSLSYNYDYTDEVKTQGLPIIPIFGVKGEF